MGINAFSLFSLGVVIIAQAYWLHVEQQNYSAAMDSYAVAFKGWEECTEARESDIAWMREVRKKVQGMTQ